MVNRYTYIIIFLVLSCLCFSNAGADDLIINSYSVETPAGDTYSDIIFYHDANALDDANKSGGSATVTYQAGITAESGILGNSWRTNAEDNSPISIPFSSNFDFDSGVVGFYWQPLADFAAGSYIVSDGQGSSGTYVRDYNVTTIRTEYRNSGTENIPADFVTNQLYYVQLTFNAGSVDYDFYECASTASCSATPDITDTDTEGVAADGSNVVFGSIDAVLARDAFIDQVMGSNDPTRDLLLIRNITTITD